MATLSLNIQLRAFDRVSTQFQNIRRTSSRLSRSFDANIRACRNLDTQMRQVQGYRAQERELSTLSNSFQTARTRARELREQLKQARSSGASNSQISALAQQYQRASTQAQQLSARHRALNTTLGQTRSELRAAGVNTRNMASAEQTLAQRVTRTNAVLTQQSQRLEQITSRQRRLNRVRQQYSQSMQRVQSTAVAGYAGVATGKRMLGGVASMVRPGIDFGEQMSSVQSKLRLDKNSTDFKAIRAQALNLGSTTSFSASEVGAGQEFLAMAGFNKDAILSSMGDVLHLAKSSNTDLATTADIASNISGAFKIDPSVVGNFERLADVLAYTTTTSNVDMRMLGDSMKYLGQSKDLNLSVEQAAAMAGMLGNVGIQGTQAGTTLSNMLNRLSAPAKAGQKAMNALGLEFTDSGDNAKDFVKFLKEVADKTKNMGNAKRAGYLKDMFGKTGVSGMTELVNQAGEGKLDKYVVSYEKIKDVNKKMSAVMSDNIAGDLKNMSSAWEGFNIAVTGTKTSMIRQLAQSLTGIVRKTTEWVKANPKLAGTILTIITALGAFMTVSGSLLVAVAGLVGPVLALQAAFKMLAIVGINPVVVAVAAFAAGAYLIYQNWDGIKAYFADLWNSIKFGASMAWASLQNTISNCAPIQGMFAAWSAVTTWFSELWTSLKTSATDGIARIGEAITNFSPITFFRQIFESVLSYFGIELPENYFNFFTNIGTRIKNAIMSWAPVQWIQGVFSGAFEWIDGKLSGMVQSFINIKNKISNFFSSSDAKVATLNAKATTLTGRITAANNKVSRNTTVNQTNHFGGGGNARQVAHHAKRATRGALRDTV